uniref:Uncharacterized protein n=1 Tax=Arundo donax TaxID=35708 RepID=A0A0A9GBH4_ARUDO
MRIRCHPTIIQRLQNIFRWCVNNTQRTSYLANCLTTRACQGCSSLTNEFFRRTDISYFSIFNFCSRIRSCRFG